MFLAFDLLKKGRSELEGKPLARRRPLLEDFAARYFTRGSLFSPLAGQSEIAGCSSVACIGWRRKRWRDRQTSRSCLKPATVEACEDHALSQCGLRHRRLPVRGKRSSRSEGCWFDSSGALRRQGLLHHVGFSSGIKAKDKPALTDKLKAIRQDRSFTGNAPGGPSRWSTKRTSEWQPVKPKYVVEISYDHYRRSLPPRHVHSDHSRPRARDFCSCKRTGI